MRPVLPIPLQARLKRRVFFIKKLITALLAAIRSESIADNRLLAYFARLAYFHAKCPLHNNFC
jgi:hypothetical protein